MVSATPGVRVSVPGLAVTPMGKPVMVTATVPVKPLIAVAARLKVWPVAPGVSETAAGVAAREKSGVVGAGAGAGSVPPPPPQDSSPKPSKKPQATKISLETLDMFSLALFRSMQRSESAIFRWPGLNARSAGDWRVPHHRGSLQFSNSQCGTHCKFRVGREPLPLTNLCYRLGKVDDHPIRAAGAEAFADPFCVQGRVPQ